MSGNLQTFGHIVFASDRMARLCQLADLAAGTDLPVLIQGETGTGKELMARAVHGSSQRRDFPFLAQNCSALPDDLLASELFGHKRGAFTGAISDRLGLFPAADGGTVFLDEIADVSPSFQNSLLRFLQDGEVRPLGTHKAHHCNVRIIAASNQPLEQLVAEGRFRRDLFYRLRGFELNIPPLRERLADIPVLAEHCARSYAESIRRQFVGFAAEVLQRFRAYDFPGNVRELEYEVRRMVAIAADGEPLSARLLSDAFAHEVAESCAVIGNTEVDAGAGTLKEQVESLERRLVAQSLRRHDWNHSRAARELGLSRVGLANKIRRYRLTPVDAEAQPG